MAELLLKLVNISITASIIAAVAVLFRFIFQRRVPRWVICLMWGLVGIRLLLPVTIESPVSLMPTAEPIPQSVIRVAEQLPDNQNDPVYETEDEISAPSAAADPVTPPVSTAAPAKAEHDSDTDSVNPASTVASVIWVAGATVMLLYAVIGFIRIKRKVREATPLNDNIWICDNINTPFILGVFKPRIYLPSSMNENDAQLVLAHEKAHLSRRDNIWKPLGFILLSVYWFNPVMWLSYILFCRDIEFACDEKVLRRDGEQIKKQYSEALVNCSVPKHMLAVSPLAFAETGVKGRVKGVLSYKKPAFWLIVVAVLICIAVGVVLLTSPMSKADNDVEYGDISTLSDGTHYFKVAEVMYKGDIALDRLSELRGDTTAIYASDPVINDYITTCSSEFIESFDKIMLLTSADNDGRTKVYFYTDDGDDAQLTAKFIGATYADNKAEDYLGVNNKLYAYITWGEDEGHDGEWIEGYNLESFFENLDNSVVYELYENNIDAYNLMETAFFGDKDGNIYFARAGFDDKSLPFVSYIFKLAEYSPENVIEKVELPSAPDESSAEPEVSKEVSTDDEDNYVQREMTEEMKATIYNEIHYGQGVYDPNDANCLYQLSFYEESYYANHNINGYTLCHFRAEYAEAVLVDFTKDGYKFSTGEAGAPSYLMLYLYKDGKFTTIEDALKSGLVNAAELYEILSSDPKYGVKAKII